MNKRLVSEQSSHMVRWPVLAANLLISAVLAFLGYLPASFALMFLFLLALLARLWGGAAAKHLDANLSLSSAGVFPGEKIEAELSVNNEKFLPVPWLALDLGMSGENDACLAPEDGEDEKRLSLLLWYEKTKLKMNWLALRRGVYDLENCRVYTGDGFGLVRERLPLAAEAGKIAVYPELVDVKAEALLKNLWNSDTGAKGVNEDVTVIRSTRDYRTTDPAKHINWRLAARGLPLTVNVYEDILPKSVHFIFDGESFFAGRYEVSVEEALMGKGSHRAEMEESLSVLASEIVRLRDEEVRCGLSLPEGRYAEAQNLMQGTPLEALLYALAEYEEKEIDFADPKKTRMVRNTSRFDTAGIQEETHRVGHFCYVAYDLKNLAENDLLTSLDPSQLTIFTFAGARSFGEYEVMNLLDLLERRAVA